MYRPAAILQGSEPGGPLTRLLGLMQVQCAHTLTRVTVTAIINPVAGACKGHGLGEMLRRVAAQGHAVQVMRTSGPGQATGLARRAAEAGGYVIAAGGDGTVREVAAGLLDTPCPLLIWPGGTENLAAKSLGFRRELDTIPAALRSGRVATLDVAFGNGHPFLVVAGVGFDAEVVRRLVGCRTGHITHLSYCAPIWRTFWEYKSPPVRVLHEGHTWWEGRGMVFIGNMARYSLGLPVVRDARPDDGLLDLLVMPWSNKLELLAHSLRTVIGRHIEHGGAKYMRVTSVRIESDASVPVEFDGDCAGTLPLDVEVRPAALHVQLPPGGAVMPRPSWLAALLRPERKR